MSIDTRYIDHKKREHARLWFAHRGINPDNTFTNPEDRQFSKLDFPPIPVKYENGFSTQCQIDIITIFCSSKSILFSLISKDSLASSPVIKSLITSFTIGFSN